MNLNEWLGILGFALGLLSALVLILQFIRGRKIDNENVLFEAKLKAYQDILHEVASLVIAVEKSMGKIANTFLLSEEVRDLTVKSESIIIDNAFTVFRVNTAKYLYLLPSKVYVRIELLYKSLLENKEHNNEEINFDDPTLGLMDGMYVAANMIYDEMRADLNLDILESSLFKRTTGKFVYK